MFLIMFSLPALLTPVPLVLFATEEIISSTNEMAKAAYKAGWYLVPCFFI